MKGQLKGRENLSLTQRLEKEKTIVISLYPYFTKNASWCIEVCLQDAKEGTVAISFLRNGETATDHGSFMFIRTTLDNVEMLVNISVANYQALRDRGEALPSRGYGIYKEMLKLLEKGGRDDVRSKRA